MCERVLLQRIYYWEKEYNITEEKIIWNTY
jgi:hypothetical protein